MFVCCISRRCIFSFMLWSVLVFYFVGRSCQNSNLNWIQLDLHFYINIWKWKSFPILLSILGRNPTPHRTGLAGLPFFFPRARPSEASSGPADPLPLCVPRTHHPRQPARLTPPFNSHRMAQARPSGQHWMNHRRLPRGDRAEEPG
jgi:hypothetical protein